MKTFQEWMKIRESSLEDKEEELGQDLDGDNEEGESEEHKKAVLGNCKKCKMAKKKCKCS
jgi:hypothetical protein